MQSAVWKYCFEYNPVQYIRVNHDMKFFINHKTRWWKQVSISKDFVILT